MITARRRLFAGSGIDDDGSPGHFIGSRNIHELQHGGRDIAESAIICECEIPGNNQWYESGRMCGIRATILVCHALGVTMVGGDYTDATVLHNLRNDLAHAFVNDFDRLNRRLDYSGMAHHVTIGKVQDSEIKFLLFNHLYENPGYFAGAHLRFFIIGLDISRRWYQFAYFARIILLDTTIEEKGYMGILLGFSDMKLGLAGIGDDGCQYVLQRFRSKGHWCFEGCVVLCHADEVGKRWLEAAIKAFKLADYQGASQFTGAIGPKVEEDDAVIGSDPRAGFVIDYGGQDELVGHGFRVGVADDF